MQNSESFKRIWLEIHLNHLRLEQKVEEIDVSIIHSILHYSVRIFDTRLCITFGKQKNSWYEQQAAEKRPRNKDWKDGEDNVFLFQFINVHSKWKIYMKRLNKNNKSQLSLVIIQLFRLTL